MVMERSEHTAMHFTRYFGNEIITCKWCSKKFSIEAKLLHHRDRKKAGPFCSRRCSGQYGKAVQLGLVDPNDYRKHN